MSKKPTEYERYILLEKFTTISRKVSPDLLLGFYASICQRALVNDSGMIRTQTETHNRLEIVAAHGMPCGIPTRNSKDCVTYLHFLSWDKKKEKLGKLFTTYPLRLRNYLHSPVTSNFLHPNVLLRHCSQALPNYIMFLLQRETARLHAYPPSYYMETIIIFEQREQFCKGCKQTFPKCCILKLYDTQIQLSKL